MELDAQLIQAMGAMTVAERQRKHYASKSEEERKELNRKKTEAALRRRQAKRAEEEEVKRAEEVARAEQVRTQQEANAEKAKVREETVTPKHPSARLTGAKLLVKHRKWSETLGDIKMLPDTANPETDRVFPSQYLLITPDGKTAWWMEERDLTKKWTAEEGQAATLSSHKFHKKGGVWVEEKPPTHSPAKSPWTNAFFYLKWDTPRPLSSYSDSQQKFARYYDYAL
jgi:hypothetical protein